MGNERNVAEDASVLASIYESYTYDDSDDGYISMNVLEDIWDGSYIHPDINAIYVRLKICDHINPA